LKSPSAISPSRFFQIFLAISLLVVFVESNTLSLFSRAHPPSFEPFFVGAVGWGLIARRLLSNVPGLVAILGNDGFG